MTEQGSSEKIMLPRKRAVLFDFGVEVALPPLRNTDPTHENFIRAIDLPEYQGLTGVDLIPLKHRTSQIRGDIEIWHSSSTVTSDKPYSLEFSLTITPGEEEIDLSAAVLLDEEVVFSRFEYSHPVGTAGRVVYYTAVPDIQKLPTSQHMYNEEELARIRFTLHARNPQDQ